jgi:hypothetical protein
VLGALLQQRGLLVLHGSSVCIEGSAVAFLGGKGWGKSTLAAALYYLGHSVVTDDIVAVSLGPADAPAILPCFPQLKLWPEAAASLGDSVEDLPRLHPEFEKRARPVRRGFSQHPVPLKRIYILDEGDEPEISELHPRDAFVELVRHSYAVELLAAAETAEMHFGQCSQLVKSVSICRLRKTRSLEALPSLAVFVRDDLARGMREVDLGRGSLSTGHAMVSQGGTVV